MAMHKIDDDRAFEMLAKVSQEMNVKVAEVASPGDRAPPPQGQLTELSTSRVQRSGRPGVIRRGDRGYTQVRRSRQPAPRLCGVRLVGLSDTLRVASRRSPHDRAPTSDRSAPMGTDDKVDNKAEELAARPRRPSARRPATTRSRPRATRPAQVLAEAGRREGQGRLQEGLSRPPSRAPQDLCRAGGPIPPSADSARHRPDLDPGARRGICLPPRARGRIVPHASATAARDPRVRSRAARGLVLVAARRAAASPAPARTPTTPRTTLAAAA